MKKTTLAAVGAAAASLFALAAPGVAAHAATTSNPYDYPALSTRDGSGDKSGYAALRNTRITWSNSNRAIVSGIINDVCPADGRMAGVMLIADYDTEFGSGSMREEVVDDSGCGSSGQSFTRVFSTGKQPFRLMSIRVVVCEVGDSAMPVCVKQTYANPFR